MRSRGRKAVSPIVATLLLILIAVAAAVVLYSWVSGLTSSTKTTGAERTGVAFTIEAAKINATGNITTIWVRNVGSVPIDNGTWSLYILDPTTGNVVTENTSWTFNSTISPGELKNLNVTGITGLNSGDYYTVRVVSPQGVSDSIYVKAQ